MGEFNSLCQEEGAVHLVGILNVREPLGFPGVAVHDDAHILNRPRLGEEFKQVPLICFQGQVVGKDCADVPVELLQFPLLLPLLPHLWGRAFSPAWPGPGNSQTGCGIPDHTGTDSDTMAIYTFRNIL